MTCAVKDCDGKRMSLGLCGRHYARLRRGQPLDANPTRLVDPARVVIVLERPDYEELKKKAEAKLIVGAGGGVQGSVKNRSTSPPGEPWVTICVCW